MMHATQPKIWTITALNARIRDILEDNFPLIWVEGEVSNLRRPPSGHVYFTLKDDQSQIRAVIFRPATFDRTPPADAFTLEDGMTILCRARVGVYPPRGEYQLIVDFAEPRGLGALQKAFEQLKARLEIEGLFDPAKKKRIPLLPSRIGVITSPTGAVIRDILNITKRRFHSVHILVAPVRVQGTEAPVEIVDALASMELAGNVDVIILARGGGSLEDLAPFNDERVARAIYRCTIPVISAVGHETDFTIADFAADLRAPTPSAAAELVVPNRNEMKRHVAEVLTRLVYLSGQRIRLDRQVLANLAERLGDPGRLIADGRLAVDDRLDDLRRTLGRLLETSNHTVKNFKLQLQHSSPLNRIQRALIILGSSRATLETICLNRLELLKKKLAVQTALLDSLSPLAVLGRGYSITRTWPGGRVVRRAGEVKMDQTLDITLESGHIIARVANTYEEGENGKGKL
jgi:exodeoxyribonuclease VII large subunit